MTKGTPPTDLQGKTCADNRQLLDERLLYPLKAKVHLAKERIREWYEYHDGQVYVAFSGGKDSTVLLHIVRELYPDVPGVFFDTGLEYPEIKKFVKSIPNVVIRRPKMRFREVIEEHGYAVVSKQSAKNLRMLQNPTPRNAKSRSLALTGLTSAGKCGKNFKLPIKWRFLIDAPFKISERCCDALKKEPASSYMKESGRVPFVGTMVGDSSQRQRMYLRIGCNSFESERNPRSTPLAFFTEADVWQYLRENEVPYSEIYDMGEKRTGCMWCMFGVHLEKGENRFQRMKKTHRNQWNYCMKTVEEGGLGMREILEDYIGVEVE